MENAKWYVVHTYSGYENKVKVDIEKTIKNRGLENQIFEVAVPMQTVLEIKEKSGKSSEKISEKKLFPGYVLVKMIHNDETWYVIRNTRGVTGFVGPSSGGELVELSPQEVHNLGLDGSKVNEVPKLIYDFEIGDFVEILDASFEGFEGKIVNINEELREVVVRVDMLSGETNLTLGFSQIKKIQ